MCGHVSLKQKHQGHHHNWACWSARAASHVNQFPSEAALAFSKCCTSIFLCPHQKEQIGKGRWAIHLVLKLETDNQTLVPATPTELSEERLFGSFPSTTRRGLGVVNFGAFEYKRKVSPQSSGLSSEWWQTAPLHLLQLQRQLQAAQGNNEWCCGTKRFNNVGLRPQYYQVPV